MYPKRCLSSLSFKNHFWIWHNLVYSFEYFGKLSITMAYIPILLIEIESKSIYFELGLYLLRLDGCHKLRISSMYLDTLLMPKISKSYTVRFSQIWFFYHLKIFKSYEFSQNLKVVAQKLPLPHPFQF